MSHMLSSSGMILGTKNVSILLLVSPWNDVLTYLGSWDTPPRPGEFGFQSFQNAFKRFLESRTVWIRRRNRQEAKAFDDRKKESCPFVLKGTPNLGQSPELKLMPFQVRSPYALFGCLMLNVSQGRWAEVAPPELVGASTLYPRR